MNGNSSFHGTQSLRQLFIPSTNQNKLHFEGRAVNVTQNLLHLRRAIPTKEDNPRGKMRIEAQLFSLFDAVQWFRLIEPRVQDHPRSLEDGLLGMSHSPGLFDGPFGPANEVLLLAFDPEMRGIIRQVREDGNERSPRKRLIEALSKCAVEMGNQRYHHVWVVLKPEALEHLNRRIVIQTYGKLQDA